MKELDDFIKRQYDTFNHFENSIKETDNDAVKKSLNEKLWFLNRIIQLAVIVQKTENQSLNK